MKNFDEIYKKVYEDSFEEVKRAKRNRNWLIYLAIILLSFSILGVIFLSYFKFKWLIITNISIAIVIISCFVCCIVISFLACCLAYMKNIKFKKAFKSKIIGPLIKNVDENLEYKPEGIMQITSYKLGEFEKFNNFYSEDVIYGKLYGKYDFKMAEVRTEIEFKSEEHGFTRIPVFTGLFGFVTCVKNIETKFKIRSNNEILKKLLNIKTKLEMDSQEFEKYFDVYGENKILIMQILTADVMNSMIEFIKQSKIKYELTFRENKIYIRFHTGNMFEPKLFKSPLNYKMLKKYYEIIEFVINVTKAVNEALENADI